MIYYILALTQVSFKTSQGFIRRCYKANSGVSQSLLKDEDFVIKNDSFCLIFDLPST